MEIDNCDSIKAGELETLRLFQTKIFYQQLMEEQELTDFISDRSIFDIVAYMEYYKLPADLVEEFAQYAIKHSTTYDTIIYCPIPKGAELEADGFRLVEGQKEYDLILKRLLFQAECRVVKLTRDRDQWVERVMAIAPVKKYLKARNRHEQGNSGRPFGTRSRG